LVKFIKHGEIKSQVFKPSLLFPKAFFENGRSSGLPQLAAAFPFQKDPDSGHFCYQHERITAAGTAPEFHRIPFYYLPFTPQK
jgi:hypothetical protein